MATRPNRVKEGGLRFWNSQRGFTMLELLAAAIIILALVTASVAMISRVEKWANAAQAKIEITYISMALEMEKDDTGFYTLNLEDLGSQTAPPGIESRSWRGPYLKGDFYLDPWNNSYVLARADGESFTPVSAKQPYSITSRGADKLPGGKGPNADITWRSDYSDFQD